MRVANISNLATVGSKFYGVGIAGLGALACYYGDFPYMLIPQNHSWIPNLTFVSSVFGIILIGAEVGIIFEKNTKAISLLLACILLLIFCFYFIPYQLLISQNFTQFGDWENAIKELALSGGAFLIANSLPGKNKNAIIRLLTKLIPMGRIIFASAMICFGIGHLLYAKEAAGYIPSWIPYHLFWIYFAGIPLLGSGIAIIINIKIRLVTILLGILIFIWLIILHIPYVIAVHFADSGGEVTSALLALIYSGTAFVIAGSVKNDLNYIRK